MVKAKVVKRNNEMFDIRGVPMYKCSECNTRFQTKAIAEQHMRRKHGSN